LRQPFGGARSGSGSTVHYGVVHLPSLNADTQYLGGSSLRNCGRIRV
jgi:hypothetical protein